MNLFLLTPLREGRRCVQHLYDEPGQISTHAPAGGATGLHLVLLPPGRNFYSRPCGRGDQRRLEEQRNAHISTHAPAGGATSLCAALELLCAISTHAPAGGATHALLVVPGLVLEFLLTPLREGRPPMLLSQIILVKRISTHAPAGGATRPGSRTSFSRSYFYSRPCGRGDAAQAGDYYAAQIFLLTPLREGRPALPQRPGDLPAISTHAPAGGATAGQTTINGSNITFLLTPLREGRLGAVQGAEQADYISTHAPAGGATVMRFRSPPTGCVFLLTPLREGRPSGQSEKRKQKNFYSRPCGRGDALFPRNLS